MMVDPDPKRQRCEGILGATDTAGAEAGAKVTSMVNQLTSLLLAKSVVGETHEIDTNNIKVRHSWAPYFSYYLMSDLDFLERVLSMYSVFTSDQMTSHSY